MGLLTEMKKADRHHVGGETRIGVVTSLPCYLQPSQDTCPFLPQFLLLALSQGLLDPALAPTLQSPLQVVRNSKQLSAQGGQGRVGGDGWAARQFRPSQPLGFSEAAGSPQSLGVGLASEKACLEHSGGIWRQLCAA